MAVITTKKSQATMTLAWLRTKVSQRCFGSGVRTGRCLRRYLPTVRGEIRILSFRFNSTDEGIGLNVHQGVTPGEQAAQNYHKQPSGIISAVWLCLPLLQQGELFAQEEILGSQCAAGPGNEHEETDEIARDGGQRPEAMR